MHIQSTKKARNLIDKALETRAENIFIFSHGREIQRINQSDIPELSFVNRLNHKIATSHKNIVIFSFKLMDLLKNHLSSFEYTEKVSLADAQLKGKKFKKYDFDVVNEKKNTQKEWTIT